MNAIKQSYCHKRLSFLKISDEENSLDEKGLYQTFENDGSDNILIRYSTLTGSLMDFKPKGSRLRKGYARTRLKNAIQDKEGKTIKYLSAKSSGIRPFFNGIVKFFPTGDIDTLLLTEGEFKAFLGCKYGVPTVGLSGIHCFGHVIRDEEEKVMDVVLLPELEEFIKGRKVKNIILLHDADATANQNNPSRRAGFYSSVDYFIKACKKLGASLHYSHIKSDYIKLGKGLDDLIATYRSKADAICKELLSLKTSDFFQFFNLQQVKSHEIENYFITQAEIIKSDEILYVKQYVSEKTTEFYNYLHLHKRVILKARTGSGKTTLVLDHLAELFPGRIIILQPLTVIVDAIANQKYGKIGVIKEGATEEDILIALHSKVVVCTYDSFAKINNYTDNDLIIGDEIHYLINAYNMPDKRAKYEYAFKRICEAKNVLLISATPQQTLRKCNFKWLEVIAAQSNKISIHKIEYEGKIHHYLPDFLNTFDTSKGKIIVRLNAEEKAKEIAKLLKSDKVQLLSADGKEDPAGLYNHVASHKALPEELAIMISTSVIDCGVDINNTDIQAVIIAEDAFNVNEADTLQFVARFRRVDNLQVYIFKKVRQVSIPSSVLYDELAKFAEGEVRRLNEMHNYYTKSPYVAKAPDYSETAKFSLFNKAANVYEVNRIALLHEVNRINTDCTPSGLYFERLSKETHIEIVSSKHFALPVNQSMLVFDKNRKQAREKNEKTLLDLLATDTQYVFIAACFKIKDLSLRKKILAAGYNIGSQICDDAALLYATHKEVFDSAMAKAILNNYLLLKAKGIEPSCICKILKEYKGRVLGDMLSQLALLYKLEADSKELSLPDQRDAARIKKHKEDLLTAAGPLTAKQITEIINRSRPKGIKLTLVKAVRLYRMLFAHSSQVIKVGKKNVRRYLTENQITYKEFTATGLTIINNKISDPVAPPEDIPDWLLRKDEPCPF